MVEVSTRLLLMLCLAVLAAACARIEPPPGGPPDELPPVLVATRPDSLATLPRFEGEVEFAFDEVVSEGGQPSMGLGTSDLERLILLSPTENVPRVRWKRSVIGVEPKEGWRPNRVYRVELRPGITDLQRNRLDSGAVITFSTGAPLPTVTLSGRVVDWQAGRMAQSALIDAILFPDSLRYRAISDSNGGFQFGPLPRGEYLVHGVIDQNRNQRRDLRDNFDTVRVRSDSSVSIGVLWAFPHDTVGPRLTTVTPLDSLAADLGFNQQLDPYQQFDTTNVRVFLLPDSTRVSVLAVRTRALDDSLQRLARQAADTTRRVDTTQAAIDSARREAEERLKQRPAGGPSDADRALLTTRPTLFDHLVVRLTTAFVPGRQYVVETRAVRNVNRVAADSRLPLRIAERPPPAPDSLAPVQRDSLRPDSVPPPVPRP